MSWIGTIDPANTAQRQPNQADPNTISLSPSFPSFLTVCLCVCVPLSPAFSTIGGSTDELREASGGASFETEDTGMDYDPERTGKPCETVA